jgi:capsid protein
LIEQIKSWFKKTFGGKNANLYPAPPVAFGPYSSVSNDGASFEYGISNSGSGNEYDHDKILQNARTAYFESLEARTVIDRMADIQIDTGLRLEPSPKYELLGISQDEAERWADNVSQRFDAWFGSKKCMRDESMTGYQSQYLVCLAQHRDNDYFVRMHYSNRSDLLNPLQISFVDPTQIQGCGISDTWGNTFRHIDGISRDSAGRETSYKVLVEGKNGLEVVTIPAYGPRSGRRFMLHGYRPEYFGQRRGLSRMGASLQRYANITDYGESHIQKAISQSQTSLYVKPSKDAPASDPYETMSGRFRDGVASNMYSQRDPGSGELTHVEYTDLPEATFRRPGSAGVFMLQGGEDLKPFEHSAPVEGYSQFVDSYNSYPSAAIGMPLEVALMRFGTSYSASRASLILVWRVAEIWRNEMASDYLNPVYESWLSEEIASGRVRAPGWSDPRMREAWLSCGWSGIPMPNIDPSKTAKADEIYVKMGAQHLDQVAHNHNGSDGKMNRAKLQKQYSELDLPPWEKAKNNNG